MNYKSKEELYNAVLPALKIKSCECNKMVSEKEIFDYLTNAIWVKTHDLTLAKVVDDILKCDVLNIKKGEKDYE